jgi:hypothetical protein
MRSGAVPRALVVSLDDTFDTLEQRPCSAKSTIGSQTDRVIPLDFQSDLVRVSQLKLMSDFAMAMAVNCTSFSVPSRQTLVADIKALGPPHTRMKQCRSNRANSWQVYAPDSIRNNQFRVWAWNRRGLIVRIASHSSSPWESGKMNTGYWFRPYARNSTDLGWFQHLIIVWGGKSGGSFCAANILANPWRSVKEG